MTNQLNSGAANRHVTEGTGTVVCSGRPGSLVRRRSPWDAPVCRRDLQEELGSQEPGCALTEGVWEASTGRAKGKGVGWVSAHLVGTLELQQQGRPRGARARGTRVTTGP